MKQASQGLVNAMSTMLQDKEITLREAVGLSGLSGLIPQILGTPQMIADELEYIWRETGCHGFNITPAIVPKGYDDFRDQSYLFYKIAASLGESTKQIPFEVIYWIKNLHSKAKSEISEH